MILQVNDLHIKFHSRQEEAVRGISFNVEQGEIKGLVGESGSGKSVTAQSIMGLLDRRFCDISGEIILCGEDVTQMDEDKLASIRGKTVSMVFQDPFAAMNPLIKVGKQVEESMALHSKMTKEQLYEKAVSAMAMAELSQPEEVYKRYPFELSGGMLQRAMIASAIAQKPELLILDEPTTALDVTIQAQILKLVKGLNEKYGISMLFISHNLNVVRKLCSKTAVMEHGVIVEEGNTEEIFNNPTHPYTKRLIAAIPRGIGGSENEK